MEQSKYSPKFIVITVVIFLIFLAVVGGTGPRSSSTTTPRSAQATPSPLTTNNVQEPSSDKTKEGKVPAYKMFPPYTKDGREWKNVAVSTGLSGDDLMSVATGLHSRYPRDYFHIFQMQNISTVSADDLKGFEAYKNWDVNYPSKSYPFPEDWEAEHYLGTVQEMLNSDKPKLEWVFNFRDTTKVRL